MQNITSNFPLPTHSCADLCFVNICKHNDGGTCYKMNGLPYSAFQDIEGTEAEPEVFRMCKEFELDVEAERELDLPVTTFTTSTIR